MNRKTRIKIYVCAAIIVIASLSVYGYVNTNNRLKDDITSNLSLTVSQKAAYMDGWLVSKGRLAQDTAGILAIVNPNGMISRDYLQVFRNDPQIVNEYVGLAQGQGAAAFIGANEWNPPADYTPSQQAWYTGPVKNNSLTFSDPFLDSSNQKYVVAAGYPIKDRSGTTRGVVAIDLLLDTITEETSNMQYNSMGYGFLIDQKGRIIAHKDGRLVNKDALQDANLKPIAEYMIDKKEGIYEYEYAGEKKILSFTQLDSTGWLLAITVPEEELLSPLSSMFYYYLVFTVLLVLISLSAGFWMSTLFDVKWEY